MLQAQGVVKSKHTFYIQKRFPKIMLFNSVYDDFCMQVSGSY